jgi:ubiquinone/menaquinone biosynthesis C-methylase UbiE
MTQSPPGATSGTVRGFDTPNRAPRDELERERWARANREWWEQHPMRYDFTTPLQSEEFSPQFFAEIDARFLRAASRYMPWKTAPFDQLIDYSALPEMAVLEIGVGNGTHAQLIAAQARSYVGIDLTSYAVRSTSARMALAGLDNATILQMDAEAMAFPDNSFDFIWSWGVIHHSANTDRILAEMSRILRPGGRAVTMVYHRSLWGYYLRSGLIQGIVRGDLFRTGSLHATVQRHTDGALARYYTRGEWRSLVSRYFGVEEVRVYGDKVELFPLPAGRAKDAAMAAVPDRFARLFTNRFAWGSFLVSVLRKPGSSEREIRSHADWHRSVGSAAESPR